MFHDLTCNRCGEPLVGLDENAAECECDANEAELKARIAELEAELKKALHPDTAVRVVANVDGHHPLVSTYLTGNEVDALRWLHEYLGIDHARGRTRELKSAEDAKTALEALDKVTKR